MKKKLTAVALIVALLAVAIVGGTLAYFTDKEVATNTFTIGDVDIVLDEAQVVRDEKTGNYVPTEDGNRVDGNKYDDIFPGQKLAKDPKVTNDGPYDAYVRVDTVVSDAALNALHCVGGAGYDGFKQVVTGGIMGLTYAESKEADNGIADGLLSSDGQYLLAFTRADGKTTFTVYNLNPMAKGAAFTVFESINVPADMSNEDFALIKDGFNMVITASAIQADGFVSDETSSAAAKAFAALTLPAGEASDPDASASPAPTETPAA